MATVTGPQLTLWKFNKELYDMYWFWNDKVILVYKWVFPDNWSKLKPAGRNIALATVPARNYHNHILNVI